MGCAVIWPAVNAEHYLVPQTQLPKYFNHIFYNKVLASVLESYMYSQLILLNRKAGAQLYPSNIAPFKTLLSMTSRLYFFECYFAENEV